MPESKEWVKDPEPESKDESKPDDQQHGGNAVVVVVEKTVVKGAE